jgi:hypothetical protein
MLFDKRFLAAFSFCDLGCRIPLVTETGLFKFFFRVVFIKSPLFIRIITQSSSDCERFFSGKCTYGKCIMWPVLAMTFSEDSNP